MSESRDKERIESTKHALRMLIESEIPLPRKKLFLEDKNSSKGAQSWWQREVLKRLEKEKCIERTSSSGNKVEYAAISKPILMRVLENHISVTKLIWPGQFFTENKLSLDPAFPPVLQEEIEDPVHNKNGAEIEEDPFGHRGLLNPLVTGAEALADVLERLLTLNTAQMENLIYIRGKVAALQDEMTDIKKRVEYLEKVWSDPPKKESVYE